MAREKGLKVPKEKKWMKVSYLKKFRLIEIL
jgi:hypothetical protein